VPTASSPAVTAQPVPVGAGAGGVLYVRRRRS
jgi:hypothetical protein